MHIQGKRVSAGVAVFLLSSAAAFGETVHLKEGGLIRGEVIARKADRVFVDLGFTVVTIPAESIERIVEDDTPEGEGAGQSEGGQLWSTDERRPEMTIKQNVQRVGEGVVQVRTTAGLGSGFVVHPDGYVITNDHVVAGEHEIGVTVFIDGEKELRKEQHNKVRIVASSPDMDLALLKIEAPEGRTFKVVPLADGEELRQGQSVFAVGSPLGLERSVSQGIVSLKNREMDGRLYIQTTTQINPGNSGGPLFDLNGRVVGVTNMKIVSTGAEGLGFAIPVDVLKHFVSNRDAFAFDPRNPNAGFRYYRPPTPEEPPPPATEEPASPEAGETAGG